MKYIYNVHVLSTLGLKKNTCSNHNHFLGVISHDVQVHLIKSIFSTTNMYTFVSYENRSNTPGINSVIRIHLETCVPNIIYKMEYK